MSDTNSQATAGNDSATDGGTPQTAETTTQSTTTETNGTNAAPTVEEVLKGNNAEALRALLRGNSGRLADSPRDGWTEFDPAQDDEPAPENPDADAAATPGEKPEGEQAAEPSAEEQAAAAKAEADAEAAKPKRDANRVRINRFAEADRAVIARMAEKDGLTIDQARAELIAEGKLPKAETTAATAKAEAAEPGTEIATKNAEIATLEKEIEEAASVFDSVKGAKLQMAHNRALADLGKLEARAEARQSQAQTVAQTQHQAAEAKAGDEAIGMFPDSGVEGSALREAIEDLIDAAPATAFQDPDWPITFAAKAARDIGYVPKATAQPTTLVPKKPVRTASPSPASGSTTGAAPVRPPSIEQQLAEAGSDVTKLKAILRAHGTRNE